MRCARPRRRACLADMRSPWTAKSSAKRSRGPSRRIRGSKFGAKKSARSIPGRVTHRCQRAADQRRAGRRHRAPHRLGAAVFLRQHQPHRGCGDGGSVHRLPRVAVWQVARWHRRLSELPDESRRVRALRDGAAGRRRLSNAHIADDVTRIFESCLPIEEIARRGKDTLRFGPMKPMGLTDPRTGRRPYAWCSCGRRTCARDSWNLVGFQNHLRFPEQQRVLRLIPGLENAEFLRYGQIHRNTYINAPALLTARRCN